MPKTISKGSSKASVVDLDYGSLEELLRQEAERQHKSKCAPTSFSSNAAACMATTCAIGWTRSASYSVLASAGRMQQAGYLIKVTDL